MRRLATLVVGIGLVAVVAALVQAQEKPKYTIAQVMDKCMKGGLCAKVAGGKATPEEAKQLVEYFESLSANKPPKGDAAEWKKRTEELVKAAKAAGAGEKGAGAKLKGAAKCADCHKIFKG